MPSYPVGWAKSYDAEYVALARLLACPLLTADARLRRGAARGIQTMAPVDLLLWMRPAPS